LHKLPSQRSIVKHVIVIWRSREAALTSKRQTADLDITRRVHQRSNIWQRVADQRRFLRAPADESRKARSSDFLLFTADLKVTTWVHTRGPTLIVRGYMVPADRQLPHGFRCRCLRVLMKSHCGCAAIDCRSIPERDGGAIVSHESTPARTNTDQRRLHVVRLANLH